MFLQLDNISILIVIEFCSSVIFLKHKSAYVILFCLNILFWIFVALGMRIDTFNKVCRALHSLSSSSSTFSLTLCVFTTLSSLSPFCTAFTLLVISLSLLLTFSRSNLSIRFFHQSNQLFSLKTLIVVLCVIKMI